MSSFRESVTKLRSVPASEAVRLGYRKVIYRKVLLERYEIRAEKSEMPSNPSAHRVALVALSEYSAILEASPYLTEDDLARFRRQDSTCIAVMDGERIAASSWMTKGQVFVTELHREVLVPEDEHFSCRSFVDPEYRGQSLLSHMIHHYSMLIRPTDVVWGLVYGWNTASVRSLESLGWRRTGKYWSTYLFGRQHAGSVRLDDAGINDPTRPT